MKASDQIVQQMRIAAEAAMNNAYSRYSNFAVGAAVLSDGGGIFAGCNVENASYGLTMCAERNAIFQAIAKGHRDLKALVVVAAAEKPAPPCGACRQVINEFNSDADIFIFGKDNGAQQFKLLDLLPHGFGPEKLDGK